MSKVDIKVYALPTIKASNIFFKTKEWEYNTAPPIYGIKNLGWKYHYLYVTSDEAPQIGDWCIGDDFGENLHKCVIEANCKAIGCRKVVATSDLEMYQYTPNIEKISPEFKQAWVREANKGTPILEALMEFTDLGKDACKFDDNHLDSKIENLEHNCLIFGGKCSCLKKIPKLNPQGYVTILPVKEKMHTQTEVENLILQFASDCENDEDLICYDGEIDGVKQYNAAKKWLKQNL